MKRTLLAVLIAALCAAPVHAQNTVPGPRAAATGRVAAAHVSLRPDAAVTAARRDLGIALAQHDLSPTPLPGGGGLSRSEAMMVVGGVALVIGAVIEDDAGTILMVGGAIVGLIGLWRWLQQ